MKKILGLDLGSSSVGWAFVQEESDSPQIIAAGVRIVSLTTEETSNFSKGLAISTNKNRTIARGARRLIQRYKSRRHKILKLFKSIQFIPSDFTYAEEGKQTTHETYAIRAKAVTESVSPEDFVKVILMLNKKRGYKSNRKFQNIEQEESDSGGSEKEAKKSKAKISSYLENIHNRSKELLERNQTVGQYKHAKLLENPHYSFRNVVFMRADYLHEFDLIWETQKKFYPILTDDLKKEIRDITLFFQRKLKSQKHLVSFCEFEKQHKVAPKSSPVFQQFRMWQFINNLELTSHSFVFDEDVKEGIANILSNNAKIKASALLKAIGANPKTDQFNFNENEIQGDVTKSEFVKVFKKLWEEKGNKASSLNNPIRNEDVRTILTDLQLPSTLLEIDWSKPENEFDKQPYFQLWHMMYTIEEDAILVKNLCQKFNMPERYAKALLAVRMEPKYGNISVRAIRKIMPHLLNGYKYYEAVEKTKYKTHSPNSLTKEQNEQRVLVDKLEFLKMNSLRNPVVEKVLNQTIHVVNNIVETYGRPDEIRIEMSRNLKANNAERSKMTTQITLSTKEHEQIRKKLIAEFHLNRVTKNDIIRYKLWQEVDFKSLYTGKPIPATELFSEKYDIEHIIPKSRYFDDSFANKTLCEKSLNIEKSNQTAFSFLGQKFNAAEFEAYQARVHDLLKSKKISKKKAGYLLLPDENIPDDFISRQMNETRYISRKAQELLFPICRKISTTIGAITSKLRDDWGLNEVMKELNFEKYHLAGLTVEEEGKGGERLQKIVNWSKRNDHRHHAMDAITIALTKEAYIQYLNNLNAQSAKNGYLIGIENKYVKRKNGEPIIIAPIPKIREVFIKTLNSILVSQKAKNKVVTKNKIKNKNGGQKTIQLTPRGQLHEETVSAKRWQYATEMVEIGHKLTAEIVALVAKKTEREALQKRLEQFGNDPKMAFTGKNSLALHPIFLDEQQKHRVPEKVKIVYLKELYTKRKRIGPDLNRVVIEKIIDPQVRNILLERLDKFDGDPKKAFVNLDENPIFLDKAEKIKIKRVTLKGLKDLDALHVKRDVNGKVILDHSGRPIPTDFVNTGNNHHAAIYEDEKGNYHDEVVSFFEVVRRATKGEPVIKRNHEKGWKFLFTLKKNEYFVFPSPDFNPLLVDLTDPANYEEISKHLFRVQTLSKKDYFFRHHLETTVENNENALKGITWNRIRSLNKMKGAVKVRISILGLLETSDE